MERRENDLMLNVLANPDFTVEDFNSVGLTLENTSLQDKNYYKNKASVLKLFTNQDGTFNNKAFDNAYNLALSKYAEMSDKDRKNTWEAQFKYAASNIWADESEKDYSPTYKLVSVSNPTKQSYGLVGWEQAGKAKLSADELAQSSSVLLNPTEAAKDPNKAQWGKDPHNGFFDYFTDTLVMAQWDEDGTHEDPITGEIMQHRKGEYKVGKDGTYYYEKLDGRDVYGKKVLNKMNVLTEEGSALNKIDFLDSDDIHKSLGGTVMKNLLLVGGMFVPYVGPAVTALSLVPLVAGIAGTLGKMAIGSDNAFLSELEGFSKSWGLQGNVSEESQQSTWTLENFINTIGDTMALLKLQRFIFEKIPFLFKGKYAGSQKAIDTLKANKAAEIGKELDLKLKDALELVKTHPNKKNWLKVQELAGFRDNIANLKALSEVNSFVKGYNKLGEVLSKGYMTAITVADTYGEAKHAGADDWEASLLTLGYGMAEAALLNTGIGEWILPELHVDKTYMKQSLKGLIKDLKKGDSTNPGIKGIISAFKGDKTDRRKYTLNILNNVKDFFKGEFFTYGSRSKNLATATLAGGLGEGVEEVTEEVLADASKGVFNLLKWMSGSDTRLNSFGYSWEDGERKWSGKDIFDRYGMSFVGGLVGGSLTNLGTAYKTTRLLGEMGSQQAFANVVDMMRNGQGDQLRRMVDKLDLDLDKNMSITPEIDSDGNYEFKVDPENSQDVNARKVMHQTLDFILNVLDSSETNLTNDQFLDKLTLGEWRFHVLQNSLTANDFLHEFNLLNTNLVDYTNLLQTALAKLNDEKTQDSDNTPSTDTTNENKIKKIKEKIKDTNLKLKDLVDGKRAVEFASRAYFEMTPYLHSYFGILPFSMYIQEKYGKRFDDLDKEDLQEAKDSYDQYLKSPNTRDLMKLGALLHLKMSQLISEKLPDILNDVETPEQTKIINAIHTLARDVGNHLSDENFTKLAARSLNKIGTIIDVLMILDPNFKAKHEAFLKTHKDNVEKYLKDTKNINDTYSPEIEKLNKDAEDEKDAFNKNAQQELDLISLELEKLQTDITAKQPEFETKLKEVNTLTEIVNSLAGKKGVKAERDKLNKLVKELKQLNNDLNSLNKDLVSKLNEKIQKEKDLIEGLNGIIKKHKDIMDMKVSERDKKLDDLLTDLKNNNLTLETNFENETIENAVFNINTYILPLLDKGHIDKTTKLELLNVISVISKAADNSGNFLIDDLENLDMLYNQVENLPETHLDYIINLFSLTTTGQPINMSGFLENVYNQLANVPSSEIEAMDKTEELLHTATTIINMLQASVNSAMSDNISMIQLNPFGFNANLNYIGEKTGNPLNLAVVSELTAAPILNKLEQVKSKLQYVLRLYDINRGNKLSQNDNSEKALLRAEYKSFKKFFVEKGDSNPFKDWANFNQLESTIRKIVDTDKDPLDGKDKKQIEKDKTEIRDTIYDFFLANQDKLDNIDELVKIVDKFDVISPNNEMLNDKLLNVGDLSFLYSLIASASMKTSDFYSNVANTDFGKVAPLGPLIEALRIVTASVLNRNLFRNFLQAVDKSISKKIDAITDPADFMQMLATNLGVKASDLDQNIAKEKNRAVWKELLNIPKFTINLINGSAGTGKTFAIFKMLHTMLLQTPLKDKKIYFTLAAKEKKEKVIEVANNIFGKDAVTSLTINELLNHFIQDYKGITQDEKGNNIIPDGTFGFDTDNKLKSKLTIKTGIEIPGVIFIDEVSQVSESDLDALNRWANENGITVIAAGDFTQNTVEASTKLTLPSGDNISYSAETLTSKFITSPKLNIPMRSDNSVKTKNLHLVEQHINFTKDFLKEELVRLEYFRNGDNLYGEQLLDPNQINEIDAVILSMVKTLKNDDRITFVYDDPNSDLYKKLKAASYSDKINFMKGSDALGDETRYAIVDLRKSYNTATEKKQAWRYLYTGLTRAKLGSLIVSTPSLVRLHTALIDEMYSEKGYEAALDNYIQTKKQFMQEIYPNLNPLNYIEFAALNNTLNNLPQNSLPLLQSQPQLLQQPLQPQLQQPQLLQPLQQPLSQNPLQQPLQWPKLLSITEIEKLYGPKTSLRSIPVTLNTTPTIINFIPIKFTDENGNTGQSTIVRNPSNKVNVALAEVEGLTLPIFLDTDGTWKPFFGINGSSIKIFNELNNQQYLTLQNNSIFNDIFNAINKELGNDIVNSPINKDSTWIDLLTDIQKVFNKATEADNTDIIKNALDVIEQNIGTRRPILVDTVTADFANKYGIDLKHYVEPTPLDLNMYYDSVIHSVTNPNENIESLLKHHPYIGFLNLDVLMTYLNNPNAAQTESTDATKLLMFYLIKDHNGKFTLFAPSQLVDIFKNYFSEKGLDYNVVDMSILGDTLSRWDYDAQNNNYNEKLADEDFDHYKEPLVQVDTINEEENIDDEDLDYDPNPTLKYLTGMLFLIKFHSFNALELGAVVDKDGNYQLDLKGKYTLANGAVATRLDGVNGLIYGVNKGLINSSEIKKLLTPDLNGIYHNSKDVLKLIATILNIFYNTLDITNINKQLNYLFESSGNLMVNFGIKKHPSEAARLNGIADNTYMHKDENELVYGLDKTATNSEKTANILLVAIIGDKRKGEFLEIPLFSLSNPFSLIVSKNSEGDFNFPLLANLLTDLKKKNLNLHDMLMLLAKEAVNLNQYHIADYINIYTSGNYFLFRFGERTVENGQWEWKSNTDNEVREWTPARYFKNLGMTFSLQRGLSQIDGNQLVYDVTQQSPNEWTNLIDFINGEMSLRFDFGNYIYQTPGSGVLEYVDENNRRLTTLVLPGHNFILIAQGDTLLNDEEKLKYYIRLLNDASLPKKVKLVYVIPPVASLKEWYEYIDLMYNSNTRPNYRIGYINTPHLVFRLLRENLKNRSKEEANKIWQNLNINVTLGVKGKTLDDFFKCLDNLDKAYDDYMRATIQADKTTKLNIYKLLFKDKYSNTDATVLSTLTNYLLNLLSDFSNGKRSFTKDLNRINFIKSVLGNDFNIFYTTRANENESLFGAKRVNELFTNEILSNGTLNGKPFKIHGKLDAYTFKGKIPGFTYIGKFIRQNNQKSVKKSVSGYLFDASMLSLNNVQRAQNAIDKFTLRYNLPKYNIPTDSNKSVLELFDDYINSINNNPNNQFVVYSHNRKLYKYDLSRVKKGGPLIIRLDGKVVTTIINNTNSIPKFTIEFVDENGQRLSWRCGLKNGNMEVYENMEPPKPQLPTTTITIEQINSEFETIKGLNYQFPKKPKECSKSIRSILNTLFGRSLVRLDTLNVSDFDNFYLEFPNLPDLIKNYIEHVKEYLSNKPDNDNITLCTPKLL